MRRRPTFLGGLHHPNPQEFRLLIKDDYLLHLVRASSATFEWLFFRLAYHINVTLT